MTRLRAGRRSGGIKGRVGARECAGDIAWAPEIIAANAGRVFEFVELLPWRAADLAMAAGSCKLVHAAHTTVAMFLTTSDVVFAFPHTVGAKNVVQIRALP